MEGGERRAGCVDCFLAEDRQQLLNMLSYALFALESCGRERESKNWKGQSSVAAPGVITSCLGSGKLERLTSFLDVPHG